MEEYTMPVMPRLKNEPVHHYILFVRYCEVGSMKKLHRDPINEFCEGTLYNISSKFNWKERKKEYNRQLSQKKRDCWGRSAIGLYDDNLKDNLYLFEIFNEHLHIFHVETRYELFQTQNYKNMSRSEKIYKIKEFSKNTRELLTTQKMLKANLKQSGFDQQELKASDIQSDIDSLRDELEDELEEIMKEEVDELVEDEIIVENIEESIDENIIIENNDDDNNMKIVVANTDDNDNDNDNESYDPYSPHTFVDYEDIDEEAEMYDRYPFLKLIKN